MERLLTDTIPPFNPDNIVVVLVQPQHPGNIGATCRAMKNMGLKRLRVVDPARKDMEQARWMAAGARDLLENMETFDRLDDALADVTNIAGTTARTRHWRIPVLGARNLGAYLLPRAANNRVAILFGREDFGLPNEVAGRCDVLVQIPTAALKSLNLAQAVLIVTYDLMMSCYPEPPEEPRTLAPWPDRVRLVTALMQLARRVEYQQSRNQEQVKAMMHGMAGRLALDRQEIRNILGFVRKINHHLTFAGLPPADAPLPSPAHRDAAPSLEHPGRPAVSSRDESRPDPSERGTHAASGSAPDPGD